MFYMILLEQDTTRKGRVSEKVPELDTSNKNSEKYKVEIIWESAIYANVFESGHLPGLDYLVIWKNYSEEKNIWKLLSIVQYLKKLISSFYKDYLERPTATSPPINSTPLIARPTVKPTTKRKQGGPAKGASKEAKKNWMKLAYVPVKSSFFQNLITNCLHCTWELFSTFLGRRFFSLGHSSNLGSFLSTVVY